MRIEMTYYGDFHVVDEMPFATADIVRALTRIFKEYRVRAFNWPVDVDFDDKTGYWHVWFTRPVSDEDYINYMGSLQEQINHGMKYIRENYGSD